MSHFPRELLADHEEIRFELSPHWLALVWPAAWTLVSLLTLFVGSKVANGAHEDGTNQIVSIVAVLIFILLAVIPFLQWKFTMFVLTSDRLITRTGIIAKHSKEIPLERINDVAFNQRIFERMVGAGDLLIESAGERGQEVISNVRHPEQVQLAIYKEAEENGNRMMRGGA
ncbi:MAG: PH domain-containing protein, partial [Actinobacteria bacterium]|nr:PH domain-containing protein [Actinomycetota bacterium]